jgi:hypothetical protein
MLEDSRRMQTKFEPQNSKFKLTPYRTGLPDVVQKQCTKFLSFLWTTPVLSEHKL